jgi:hypothetical protein
LLKARPDGPGGLGIEQTVADKTRIEPSSRAALNEKQPTINEKLYPATSDTSFWDLGWPVRQLF